MIDKVLKSFLINMMRRASFRWKNRNVAYRAAKVKVGEFKTGRPRFGYICSSCTEVFPAKEVQIHHIHAVVPLEGYADGSEFDLTEYCQRMFCGPEGFAVVCKTCHDVITKKENAERKANKKLREENEDM